MAEHGLIFKCYKYSDTLFSQAFDIDKTEEENDVIKLVKKNKTLSIQINMGLKINRKYETAMDVPYWILNTQLTFGQSINIIDMINTEIFNNFIKRTNLKTLNKHEFLIILNLIKNFRNRCCHNNVIFNINIKNDKPKIIEILNKLNIQTSKIRLFTILKIIDIINGNEDKMSICCFVNKRINDKLKNYLDNKILSNIMNYIK